MFVAELKVHPLRSDAIVFCQTPPETYLWRPDRKGLLMTLCVCEKTVIEFGKTPIMWEDFMTRPNWKFLTDLPL